MTSFLINPYRFEVVVYDTASKKPIGGFDSASPSGIFFTTRAARTGF